MTKIYLIRHAEAEGNLYRRIHGWYDSLVTKKGWAQIAALQRRFSNIEIDAVYSSDLIRTQMTASAIFLSKDMPLHSSIGLREVGMGVWEDMTWGDAEIHYPDQIRFFTYDQTKWSVPECELFEDLKHRIFNNILSIASENDGKTIAIVTHGTAIRAFIAYIKGISSEGLSSIINCDNTGVSLIEYDAEKFSVDYLGDVSHLPKGLQTLASQTWWRNKDGRDVSNLRYQKLMSSDNLDFAYPGLSHKDIYVENTYIAFSNDKPVGALSLDMEQSMKLGVGCIKDLFMLREYRKPSFSPQLIGQAISVFRPLGYEKLCVNVSSENGEKLSFFEEYGFKQVYKNNAMSILEMDISYNWRRDKNIIHE